MWRRLSSLRYLRLMFWECRAKIRTDFASFANVADSSFRSRLTGSEWPTKSCNFSALL
jgi:hypothetical protein